MSNFSRRRLYKLAIYHLCKGHRVYLKSNLHYIACPKDDYENRTGLSIFLQHDTYYIGYNDTVERGEYTAWDHEIIIEK